MKKLLSIILLLILGVGIYLIWYIHSGSEHLPPHFHANFWVFINGERVDFSDEKYMEDVAGCSLTGKLYAKDRAHLHENNGETIHVHHDGVTWGHFFANNNIYFWEDILIMDNGEIYTSSENSGLIFFLNGQLAENPYNVLIWSKDKLIISFADHTNADFTVEDLNTKVSSNAWEYNEKYDPGSCGWTNENGIKVILRDLMHSLHWKWHHDS